MVAPGRGGSRTPPGSPLSRLRDRALDLVFPRRCVACRSFGAFLCDSCLSRSQAASPPRCSVCWMPLKAAAGSDLCHRCLDQPSAFAALRSAWVYGGAVRDAVHALKFNGLSAIAAEMSAGMAEVLRLWGPPVQAVVPVPLSARRRRQRGYDQSELLARHIARAAHLPLRTDALIRRRETAPQAQQQDEAARRANVADAFVPARARLHAAVLLVDDVVTTGVTLDVCARALMTAGATAVFCLTYARED